MDFKHAVNIIRTEIDTHNTNVGAVGFGTTVDPQKALAAILAHGMTVAALCTLTEADLVSAGLPVGLARSVLAAVKAGQTSAPVAPPTGATATQRVLHVSEEGELRRLPTPDLLRQYDHNEPGIVGAVLSERARGGAFLVFDPATRALIVDASAKRVDDLRAGRPVGDTVDVGGRPVRPRRVGEPIAHRTAPRDPLDPSRPLVDGLRCPVTGEDWAPVKEDVRRFCVFLGTRGGIRHTTPREDLAFINDAKRAGALEQLRRLYRAGSIAYDETPDDRKPSLDLDLDAAPEGGRGAPFIDDAAPVQGGAVPVVIFSADEDRRFAEALTRHLAPLRREGAIDVWHPGMTTAGDNRHMTLDRRIRAARFVVLLLSADLLAGGYERELQAIEQTMPKGSILPVQVRPCDAGRFGRLMPLPRDRRAVTDYGNADAAWTEVVRDLRTAFQREPSAPSAATSAWWPAPADLSAVHAAAITLGLASSRSTLLAGIDAMFVAGLPVSSNPSAQIHTDLHTMRDVRTLTNGQRPLVMWLDTAVSLTRSRRESDVFRTMLRQIGA